MPKCKGSNITWIRETAWAQGLEAKLLERLTEEEIRLYRTALAVIWVDTYLAAKIIQAFSELYLPGDPEGYLKVTAQIAKNQFNQIYRFVLKIFTVDAMIGKVAELWNKVADFGKPSIQHAPGTKTVVFILEGAEDFSALAREQERGYLMGMAELTGAKNVRVTLDEKDHKAWKWIIQWD